MKVLAGIYTADSGSIRLHGQPITISNPLKAQQLGISIVHQEPLLFHNLTVAENIVGRARANVAAPARFVEALRAICGGAEGLELFRDHA